NSSNPAPTMPPAGSISLSTRSRMVRAAVCQPLAANPRKIVSRAASSSRWNGWGSNSAAAGAKDLAEMMELQAAYWRKQFGALAAQAEEVRALSTKVAAAASEPLKEQLKRGADELRKAN